MEYPDEYTDEEEYQDNVLDAQRDMVEEQLDAIGNYPRSRKPESLFTLFKDVIRIGDSSKVGNLDKHELGSLNLSVRDCQRIALLGKCLKHEKFADFYNSQAEILLATSASKKGWLVELFVTTKKFAAKQASNLPSQQQQDKKQWTIFKRNNPVVEG